MVTVRVERHWEQGVMARMPLGEEATLAKKWEIKWRFPDKMVMIYLFTFVISKPFQIHD